jgi:hydroxymethylpyrimidine pyrophosphatase-like HAD family hydrolase/adenine/guanine phosphoribosyltransferase-like PRPP-binding protein
MGHGSDSLRLGQLGTCASEQALFPERERLQRALLETESSFYGEYGWCVNVAPPIGEMVEHLRRELGRAEELEEGWQRAEVMTNVFLLACAITDTIDDYLVGEAYDFSQVARVLPFAARAVRAAEKLLAVPQKVRQARLRQVRGWRENWAAAVAEFLRVFVSPGRQGRNALSDVRARLARLLSVALPADFRLRCPRIPAAFRSQDLTHFDILTLGRTFAATFRDRQRPILVVGLRTAGSYFGPLLCAYLETEGYQDVDSVTLRPKNGIARWERARLARGAKRGAIAVVVDEPPGTGGTLAMGVGLVRKAGFAVSDVVALVPVHPTQRDWASSYEFLPLRGIRVLTLEPEQWHKPRLLEPHAIGGRLAEYFTNRKYASVSVVASGTAAWLNSRVQDLSEEKFHTRLKQVYEICLRTDNGWSETRYVLAKSVGWGWLGYHAFIAGSRLSEFVPPVLGLRDGILYVEWLPQTRPVGTGEDRHRLISRIASYVAARVRSMGLGRDPAPDLNRAGQHKGFAVLADTLSRAYGWKPAAVLKRGRIRHELSRRACPVPTLIDGKMRRMEWSNGSSETLKTDFEHHGMGKTELNMTDPAYDLAEAILYFGLSQGEECKLLARYVEECGDTGIEERLYFSKLLAGRWAMMTALANLGDPRLAHRHQEFNAQYVGAWNFLTVQTARLSGALCRRTNTPRWRAPLIVMDIDGVLDKQIFGFPSTTAAGIEAVSLLHAHDVAVAVNTARTVSEVKEYCSAYGFVGGVAEYGSAVWDAVTGREKVLVSSESLDQLGRVKNALRQIPGVFLNDSYRCSIHAYTHERGTTVPLPTILIRNVMASLKVERLTFHQTYLDTTVLAREVDKGSGLLALLALAGQLGIETIAIGDSEPDLAMFRVASRSFAPWHIPARGVASLLGCRIADRSYQSGLLRIVRSVVHPDGGRCDRCRSADPPRPRDNDLFWGLLQAADRPHPALLLRALLDPMALQVFVK